MKSIANNLETVFDESALFRIQRLKSRIIKQISHEFRTPLTSIIGFAEILEEDNKIDEKERIECAGYIRNEGLRLTKLIDDLIGLDALEHGEADFQFKESDIQQTVQYALTLVSEFAESKSVNIYMDIPEKKIFIKLDHEKIVQVLFQLLHNAVRFSKSGTLVNLKVEATDKQVSISVLDNGPGIPSREIPLLFRRFGKLYQPDDETHSNGVGLAIVKYIIDRHNGDVFVQSKIGKGSVFTVRLPILS